MTFLEFVSHHVWFSFGVLLVVAMFLFSAWQSWNRGRNIRLHGWPPPHCDADGDLKDGGGGENDEDQD